MEEEVKCRSALLDWDLREIVVLTIEPLYNYCI